MSVVKNHAKIILRKNIKQLLMSMTPTDREQQSAIIAKKVLASVAFQSANRISIYLSMSSEVDTKSILQEIFRQKKQAFVPCYVGSTMTMVRLNDEEDYERLPLTKWNIKQPLPDEARENANQTGGLDLIILPGVAFTTAGARMGHGMGYYDKFLTDSFTAWPKRAPFPERSIDIPEKLVNGQTIMIGLAFRQQIVTELPIDKHDVLLDAVISSDE